MRAVSSRPSAGHRLVEQQQLAAHRERHRDLELRAFRRGESAPAGTSARSREPDLLQRGARRRLSAGSRRRRAEKRKLEPDRACTASATFSSTEKPRQDRGDLERARQAEPRARVDRQRGDVAPSKTIAAAVRRERARRSG